MLGKDRFWNRYYWFERNGMALWRAARQFDGLFRLCAMAVSGCKDPTSSSGEGYIDMKAEYQDEYKAKFDMTVPERKKAEEGATSVFNAHQ